MKTIRRPNQYLQLRGEVWYYARRVPSLIVKEIGRSMISRSLETDSVSIARKRRDMCAGADDARWHKLMPSTFGRPSVDRSLRQARQDASAMGFAYKPVEELTEPHNYEELAHRLLHLEALQTRQRVDIERAAPVLIGTVKPLDDKLEREFEGYVFGQSVARLVIPSFDENIEPNVWKTDHHEDYKRDWKLLAGAPVAATSAAPVYLAAYTGMERIQWDGGLYANNPLMMGVVDALACYELKREQIEVISIGCGKADLSPPKADAGIGQWATKLQKVTGALQLHDSLGQAGLLIGRQRILRIDPVLLQDIPLDDYKASAELLRDLADRAFCENVEAIKKFFELPASARERHYSKS